VRGGWGQSRKQEQAPLVQLFKPQARQSIEVEGRVEYIYSKPGSGWGFCTVRLTGLTRACEVTVTGQLPDDIHQGAHVRARGLWSYKDRYGWQVAAQEIRIELGTDPWAVEAWFARRFRQVGRVRARALMAAFGERIWEVIEAGDYEAVQAVEGIGPVIAASIIDSYGTYKQERETWTALADLSRSDPRRLAAAYNLAAHLLERDGHTAFSARKLQAKVASKDVLSTSIAKAREGWAQAVEERQILGEYGMWFRRQTADAEHLIAQQVGLLLTEDS